MIMTQHHHPGFDIRQNQVKTGDSRVIIRKLKLGLVLVPLHRVIYPWYCMNYNHVAAIQDWYVSILACLDTYRKVWVGMYVTGWWESLSGQSFTLNFCAVRSWGCAHHCWLFFFVRPANEKRNVKGLMWWRMMAAWLGLQQWRLFHCQTRLLSQANQWGYRSDFFKPDLPLCIAETIYLQCANALPTYINILYLSTENLWPATRQAYGWMIDGLRRPLVETPHLVYSSTQYLGRVDAVWMCRVPAFKMIGLQLFIY